MKAERPSLYWKLAGALSQPYIKIQGKSSSSSTNLIGRIRLKTAIFMYGMVYKMKGQDGALFFTGKCYQSLGDHVRALECYKKAWETASFSPVLFKEIGTCCLELGKFDEGLQYALKEVSQYPNDIDSRANLAFFLMKSHRLGDAETEIGRAKGMGELSPYARQIDQYITKTVQSKTK